MSEFANPMLPRTDHTSRPVNSAFNRADHFGDADLRKMSAEADKSFGIRTYGKSCVQVI